LGGFLKVLFWTSSSFRGWLDILLLSMSGITTAIRRQVDKGGKINRDEDGIFACQLGLQDRGNSSYADLCHTSGTKRMFCVCADRNIAPGRLDCALGTE
jgi:hypothetical protein